MPFFFKKNKNEHTESGEEILISVQDLALAFEGRTVINSLSFEIKKGDYLCIFGENGSGKSSLLHALIGIIKPSAGKIKFHGVARNQIGVLPQLAPADSDFPSTVGEVVLAGCLGRSQKGLFLAKNSKQIADDAMARLGITDISDRPFRVLSGGQKQKVMLARAIAAAEKMLFLDEPITGLDKASTLYVYSLIKELNEEGITVVSVTSDISSALKYSTKILRLNKDSYLFLDTEEYKKLPEAQRYLLQDDDGINRDTPTI